MTAKITARELASRVKKTQADMKDRIAAGEKSGNLKARISCQDGLLLLITPGAASWSYRWQKNGRVRTRGIGNYPDVSLADAREAVAELKKSGDARAPAAVPTVKELLDRHLALLQRNCKRGSTRPMNVKTLIRWLEPLHEYRADELDVALVVRKMQEQNTTDGNKTNAVQVMIASLNEYRAENGEFVNRIEGMLRLKSCPFKAHKAKAKAFTADGLSIADSGYKACKASVLGEYFFRPSAALPWLEKCVLLCAALSVLRIGSVLGLEWSMIDFKDRMIVLPEQLMKAQRQHIVPLTPQLSALFEGMQTVNSEGKIFAGIHYPTLTIQLKSLVQGKVHIHGLRSSFSTFMIRPADGYQKFDRDTIERCLSHVTGSAVQNAYDGYDYFDEKKACLEEWGRYLAETQLPEGYLRLLEGKS